MAALGDGDVLKLFPPFLRFQWEAERLALGLVHGRVGVATPALRHEGEHDGWTYLIMSRLAGASLDDVWPSLDEADRCDLLAQIGALIAEVQHVPPGPLLDLQPSWADRLRDQRAGCVARHRERGLPAALLDGIDAFLDRTADALPAGAPQVLLTGEYTPENLLVARDHGRWRIIGMIDFGDATTGPAEYDLLGPDVPPRRRSGAAPRAPRGPRLRLPGPHAAPPRSPDGAAAVASPQRSLRPAAHRRMARERARALDELAAIVWPF